MAEVDHLNPTGSMKDRMALAMIEGAEQDGLLSPGDTVVEYTGGTPPTSPATRPSSRATDPLGRELWGQSDGRVTGFVQGIGTASSLMGV